MYYSATHLRLRTFVLGEISWGTERLSLYWSTDLLRNKNELLLKQIGDLLVSSLCILLLIKILLNEKLTQSDHHPDAHQLQKKCSLTAYREHIWHHF